MATTVIAPSFDDLTTLGEAEAQSRRPTLTFTDGDVTEAQVHAAAVMADRAIGYAAQIVRDLYLDGASGDALTTLVDDRCNIQRTEATAAQVTLRFTRTSSGAGGTILQGSQMATTVGPDGNQVIFATNADVVFTNADNGPHTVLATAVDKGSTGNVAAATITQAITAPFDSSVVVTNLAAAAGGNEEESDDNLRTRARTFFQTLHRGTLPALEFGAKSAKRQDGTSAGVVNARAVEDPATFGVTVYVSDADGNSTLQMVSDVRAELENWRCAGVPVTVIGGLRSQVDVIIEILSHRTGFDVSANSQAIADAVTSRINKLSAGETLYADSLTAAVIAVAPDDIFDLTFFASVDLFPPTSGDVVPAAGKVLRPGTMLVIGA